MTDIRVPSRDKNYLERLHTMIQGLREMIQLINDPKTAEWIRTRAQDHADDIRWMIGHDFGYDLKRINL
jgi:hypothetical protein